MRETPNGAVELMNWKYETHLARARALGLEGKIIANQQESEVERKGGRGDFYINMKWKTEKMPKGTRRC